MRTKYLQGPFSLPTATSAFHFPPLTASRYAPITFSNVGQRVGCLRGMGWVNKSPERCGDYFRIFCCVAMKFFVDPSFFSSFFFFFAKDQTQFLPSHSPHSRLLFFINGINTTTTRDSDVPIKRLTLVPAAPLFVSRHFPLAPRHEMAQITPLSHFAVFFCFFFPSLMALSTSCTNFQIFIPHFYQCATTSNAIKR